MRLVSTIMLIIIRAGVVSCCELADAVPMRFVSIIIRFIIRAGVVIGVAFPAAPAFHCYIYC
jgi:hypothetical protein